MASVGKVTQDATALAPARTTTTAVNSLIFKINAFPQLAAKSIALIFYSIGTKKCGQNSFCQNQHKRVQTVMLWIPLELPSMGGTAPFSASAMFAIHNTTWHTWNGIAIGIC